MKTNHIEKLIAAGMLAVLAAAAGGCAGVRNNSTNSYLSQSASAQVKVLCDSATAKANAGDTAGAKRDIDFAIANAARVKLFTPYGRRTPIDTELGIGVVVPLKETQDGKIIYAAVDKIYAGNIDEAYNMLNSLYCSPGFYGAVVHEARVEAYTIIGDMKRARDNTAIMENSGEYFFAAPLRALTGDYDKAVADTDKMGAKARAIRKPSESIPDFMHAANTQMMIGDFYGAESSLSSVGGNIYSFGVESYDGELRGMTDDLNRARYALEQYKKYPSLAWSNPNNPRRVALAQISKARCALAVAQAKAGDMGGAKNTLYFINDEQDRIATERVIASAGESFLQSGNVAKGIDTLVVIPPASQATAEQIRQNTKTWIDIKNNKLEGILAKMSEKDKNALLDKLELAILDCTTQSNSAKNMAASAAQTNSGSAFSLAELSDNYLNLQNILKAVYKTVKEE